MKKCNFTEKEIQFPEIVKRKFNLPEIVSILIIQKQKVILNFGQIHNIYLVGRF